LNIAESGDPGDGEKIQRGDSTGPLTYDMIQRESHSMRSDQSQARKRGSRCCCTSRYGTRRGITFGFFEPTFLHASRPDPVINSKSTTDEAMEQRQATNTTQLATPVLLTLTPLLFSCLACRNGHSNKTVSSSFACPINTTHREHKKTHPRHRHCFSSARFI
jgi:hypothetical protein